MRFVAVIAPGVCDPTQLLLNRLPAEKCAVYAIRRDCRRSVHLPESVQRMRTVAIADEASIYRYLRGVCG